MKWILIPINLLYRFWFYVMIAFSTIVLFPFLFIFTIREKDYDKFSVVAKAWGGIILFGMGYFPKTHRVQKLDKDKSYVIVANHSSMIDIMMMFWIVNTPFVFIGKKELAKMPLFGFFYKRSSILVDRNDRRSKLAVFKEAQRRFDQGNSICIFPEGGVPKDPAITLARFKDGAFRMAIDHQLPVVPVILYDDKHKFPYQLKHGLASPGRLRAKILAPVATEGMDEKADKIPLRDTIYQLILKELENPTS